MEETDKKGDGLLHSRWVERGNFDDLIMFIYDQ